MVHGLPPRPNFAAGPPTSAGSSSGSGGARRGGGAHNNGSRNNHSNNNSHSGGYPSGGFNNASGGFAYGAPAAAGAYPQSNASGGYPGYGYGYNYPSYAYGYPQQPQQQQATYGYQHPAYNYAAVAPTPAAPAPQQQHAALSNSRPPKCPAHTASDPSSSQAWRNCSHPGCKYTGPGADVEIHEGDRHLIFPRGKPVERSDEEERYLKNLAKGGAPPAIQGTGIRLETEEDIAKWIAERKRKWPTAARASEKAEEDAAAIARGENPHKRARPMDPARAAEEWGREPRPVPAGGERGRGVDRGRGRGRGQERGRGRGGGRGAAPGRGERVANEAVAEGPTEEKSATATATTAGALVSYTSSASSASDSSSDSDSSSNSDSESDSDDSSAEPKTKPAARAVPVDTRPVCKFFARTGKCRHGDRCRFAHVRPEHKTKPNDKSGGDPTAGGAEADGKDGSKDTKVTPAAKPGAPRAPAPRQPPTKRANPFARPSMLGALLANPIENTLSQLTQTIRFLVANDMLRNVELKAGEAEEQAREREKVVLVQEEEESVGEAVLVGDGGEVVEAEGEAVVEGVAAVENSVVDVTMVESQ